jgi:cytoskeletal protein CcmA (bactofilin family)
MKFGKAQASVPTEVRVQLGEGMEVNGEVKFSDVMRVDSRMSGTVLSEGGCLIVSERGTVQATVDVAYVEVFGTIEGTVTAKQRVQIHPGGRILGDIYTPVLNIEYGAVFDGQCHMIESEQAEPDKSTSALNLFTPNKPAVPLAG